MKKRTYHRRKSESTTRPNEPAVDLPATLIQPPSGRTRLELKELWNQKDLIYLLMWRDIKIRYKQTMVGATWVIFQPFITMVVFTLFFGRLVKVPSDGLPYPIFAYSALVPWTFFAHALTKAGSSLVENQAVLTKVYFPRLVFPIAAVLGGLVDFAVAFTVLLGMMLFYGVMPTIAIFTLPFFVGLAIATALAVGLWLSAINVKFRDVTHAMPFLTQLWLFVTPIAYPSSLIPEGWRAVYGLNPMAGVVEGFRWALLGNRPPPGPLLLVSILAVAALLIGGLYFFRRKEDTFADVI